MTTKNYYVLDHKNGSYSTVGFEPGFPQVVKSNQLVCICIGPQADLQAARVSNALVALDQMDRLKSQNGIIARAMDSNPFRRALRWVEKKIRRPAAKKRLRFVK